MLKPTAKLTKTISLATAVMLGSVSAVAIKETIVPSAAIGQYAPSSFSNEVDNEQVVQDLVQDWFDAWSFQSGSFTAEELRPLYAEGEILVFDDFDGSVVVLDSFQEYQDTWVPVMSSFSSWRIRPEGEIEISVGEDLALATFTWIGNGQLNNEQPVLMRQHGTLVWERDGDSWRIVHEHLTVGESPSP